MTYATAGITHVRVRPLALDVADGRVVPSPGALEVTWDSDQGGLWHQVYVGGQLAGVTAGTATVTASAKSSVLTSGATCRWMLPLG